MDRLSNSFLLVAQSFRLLMQDKELMVLPLISGVVMAAVGIGVVFGFGISEAGLRQAQADDLGLTFGLLVASYAIGTFFQAAVVAGATERMRGGNPTVGSALWAAARRAPSILMWAILSATFGTLLRAADNKAGLLGKIVIRLVGAGWSLATFFVIPAMVVEELPVPEALPRSIEVFKNTWGETLAGGLNLGIAGMVSWLALFAVSGLLVWAGAGLSALAVLIPGAILLAVLFSTLQGVFVASLFQFATSGTAAGFDHALLANAFKKDRPWGAGSSLGI
jgi:hypothetical protein